MKYDLIHNTHAHQYEFHVDGHIARLIYSWNEENSVMTIKSVQVPSDIGGRGIAAQLVEAVLERVEIEGKLIIPKCSYVVAYIERKPQWKKLVAE